MTDKERKLALYCLKASSDYHSELCEECIKYPNCDYTGQDDVTEIIIEELEKYSQIVKLMDGVVMNPPPYCRPYKYTKKQQVYDTMYEIQRIIGNVRFFNEDKESN